jgi:hypothetical protein
VKSSPVACAAVMFFGVQHTLRFEAQGPLLCGDFSGPDGVRTRGHLVKSQVLYLTKLQAQSGRSESPSKHWRNLLVKMRACHQALLES